MHAVRAVAKLTYTISYWCRSPLLGGAALVSGYYYYRAIDCKYMYVDIV